METQRKGLRVFYATGGPQDVVEAYRQESLHQAGKQTLVTDVAVSYSNQFLEACSASGASVWVVSPHPRRDRLEDGAFLLEHRPKPRACEKGGLVFHLGLLWHQLGLMWSALRYRAHVVVVGAAGHYWLYSALRLFGIRVVPILHCTFWPAGFRQTNRATRIIHWLNGWFWRHHAFATIAISNECARQVREIAGEVSGPILVILPLFRREIFSAIGEPPASRRPFTVLFAGRVERNKGVFDLLDVAATLERREPGRFAFEVCGSGGALEELRGAVAERGLGAMVHVLGWRDREQMAQSYARSHAVITPTTSSFEEGLCKVSTESILAGRPLVASRVCPAVDHLRGAVLEVDPGDIEGYAEAIRRLADDPVLYEEKRAACSRLADPYYDWNEGLGGAVLKVLAIVRPAADPRARGEGAPPGGGDAQRAAPENQSAEDRSVSR